MVNNNSTLNDLRSKIINASLTLQSEKVKSEINFTEIIDLIDNLNNTQTELFQKSTYEDTEYCEVFNSTNEAILIIDSTNGEIIDINKRTLEIYGYENKDEILKLNFINFCANYNQNSFIEVSYYFTKAIKEDAQLFDLLTSKKNGNSFWVSISLKKSEIGGKERIIAEIQEINERKKIEEELKNRENQLQILINSMPDIICFKDGEGRWLEANNFDLKLFEIENIDYKGKKDSELAYYSSFYKNAFLACEDSDELAWQKGSISRNDETILRPDGTSLIFDIIKVPTFDENGKRKGLIVAGRDITEKKLTEKQLIESEEKFKAAFKISPDAISITRLSDGKYIDINDGFEEISGYSRNEIISNTVYYLNIWNNLNDRDLLSKKLKKDGFANNIEAVFNLKHGKQIIGSMSARILEINEEPHLLAITKNITEQKKKEEELKEINLIFQSLLENSPIYVFFKDFNIKALHLSKNFEDMLGMPIKDTIGKDMYELFPSDLALSMIADDKKILYEGKLIQVDEELNGKYYTTIKFPIKKDDAPPMLAGFTIDITDRKKAEIALQQSEARLKSFMQYLPALVMIKDHEFRPIFANEQLQYLYPIDKWMGKTPKETFDQDTANKIIEKDQFALDNGYVSYEEIWTDKFGFEHNYFTQKFRIDIPDSKPLLGAIITDITKLKTSENQIKELNLTLEKRVEERTAELLQANKELESFAYTVSHDLRAPLRAIDGFTNILNEDYYKYLDENGKKVCKTISDNAVKMGNLIDDLLAFSRIGRNDLNYIIINSKLLVESVFQDNFYNLISDKYQIEIGGLPIIKGDRSMIKQVWINLISNAIKFSSKRDKPKIKIDFTESDNDYIFSISDNGSGFDTKYYDKLFGVFQRLHSANDYEGTGVGLAIVQRIINRHGGKVWADSELDFGSTFYFSIKKHIN